MAILALAMLVTWAAPAAATFHLMQIREVYPGSTANPNSEYVELQMWAEDQNHVAGHVLRTYDRSGAITGSDAFAADVPRGTDQSTLVLATPEAESDFGFLADGPLAPSGRLDPAGGAVCWENIDCVAWGDFSGSLPSSAGPPAAPSGIPSGTALRRTIAPGCATLLELADDRDDSAADFAVVFPGPRPNSVAPSERGCERPGGSGGNGATAPARSAPETTLRRRPPKRSRNRTPVFRFAADETGVSFECRLDAHGFRPCRSPFAAGPLAIGHHVFQVRGRDDSDQVDPSPARFAFGVLPRR